MNMEALPSEILLWIVALGLLLPVLLVIVAGGALLVGHAIWRRVKSWRAPKTPTDVA